MSSLHKEISFEDEICEHLAAHGWRYAEGDAASYDRAHALFPPDVLAWVQETQPEAWETLAKNHGAGAGAGDVLLNRLRDQINQRGTLDVLRCGVELLGLKKPLKVAEFKPAFGLNPDILARYEANRLRVVRQVRYSLNNENSGLPVGASVGARGLAGDPWPLHDRSAGQEAPDREGHLPSLSATRRNPQAASRRAGGRAGFEVSRPSTRTSR